MLNPKSFFRSRASRNSELVFRSDEHESVAPGFRHGKVDDPGGAHKLDPAIGGRKSARTREKADNLNDGSEEEQVIKEEEPHRPRFSFGRGIVRRDESDQAFMRKDVLRIEPFGSRKIGTRKNAEKEVFARSENDIESVAHTKAKLNGSVDEIGVFGMDAGSQTD